MDSKLLNIFTNKYIKGHLNFGGIILTPKINDSSHPYKLTWKLENPNDVSYTYLAVRNYIEDSIIGFLNLTSSSEGVDRRITNRYISFETDPKRIYLSKEMRKTIEEGLKKIRKVKYKNFEFTTKGKNSEDNYYITSNHEEIYIDVSLTVLRVFNLLTGEELTIQEITDLYSDIYNSDEMSDFNDIIGEDLFNYIYDQRTIYDIDESYINMNIGLYDTTGEMIEPEDY